MNMALVLSGFRLTGKVKQSLLLTMQLRKKKQRTVRWNLLNFKDL